MTSKSSNKKAAKKVVKREVKKTGKNVTQRKGNIKWHTGFVGAMMADLRDIGCEVKVTQEKHFVMSEYKIDLLIEKLSESSDVKGIGKYLRRYTLCEFKSPRHSLSMRDFIRLISLSNRYFVDDVNVTLADMAAMFVLSHKPHNILNELPERWSVEKPENGVYIIRGAAIFMTVMVIPELPEASYKWLTTIRLDLSIDRLKILVKELERHKDDKVFLQLLSILLDINVDSIEKGELKMQRLMTTLERTPACAKFFEKHDKAVFAKGINKGKAEGKAEGIAEGIVRGISKGIAKGKAEGIAEGIAKNIIRILTRRFDKSPSMRLQRQIMNVKDIDKLDELCDFAFDCVSLGEFATAFN